MPFIFVGKTLYPCFSSARDERDVKVGKWQLESAQSSQVLQMALFQFPGRLISAFRHSVAWCFNMQGQISSLPTPLQLHVTRWLNIPYQLEQLSDIV